MRKISILLWVCLLPAVLSAQYSQQQPGKKPAPIEGKLLIGGGLQYPDVSGLNTMLLQGGFTAQPSQFFHLGVDYQIVSESFISDLEFYWSFSSGQAASGYQVDLRWDYQLFNIGYLLINYPFLHFYPLAGIGRGAIRLSASETGSPGFTDILTNASRSFMMDNGAVIFNVGVGLDIILPASQGPNPLHFTLGVRGGYLFDMSDEKWNAGGVEVTGGPARLLSGAYARLLLGIAI